LVEDFYENKLDVARINYGVVSLIPKGKDADRIQKYRPICLLNMLFKIFTKILVNRLIQVIGYVIKESQTAFIRGRNIMEGVVVLHEVLNEMHKKKSDGIIF
jgi:hypothetical protein